MTCRINRNRLEYFGATAKAVEMPDLLTSDDPWFRPVDLQFGPDGCLYIADFYNKIIGHYEVPLEHPDRDRTSGRIWRIRYVANQQASVAPASSQATSPIADANELSRDEALALLRRPRKASDTTSAVEQLVAVERLAEVGKPADAAFLLDRIPAVDDRDAILKQAHWIASRDLLGRATKASDRFPQEDLLPDGLSSTQYEQRAKEILKVLQAVRHPSSASWSLELIVKASAKIPQGPSTPWLKEALLSVATSVDESQIPRVLTLVDLMVPDQTSKAEQILLISESQKQRNGKLSPMLVELGKASLADATQHWLTQAIDQNAKLYGWTALAAKGREHRPWPIEPRSLSAASHPQPSLVPNDKVPFWSSLGLSERYTGTWTSGPFEAKDTLSFWVAGHDGLPNETDRKENFVRVVAANPQNGDWVEVHRTYAPRNDVAKFVSVDLSGQVGQQVRVEVVDGCGLDS
ncbi:MAG: hypothetical protein ACKOOI_00595, partial [Pirellula sp.]